MRTGFNMAGLLLALAIFLAATSAGCSSQSVTQAPTPPARSFAFVCAVDAALPACDSVEFRVGLDPQSLLAVLTPGEADTIMVFVDSWTLVSASWSEGCQQIDTDTVVIAGTGVLEVVP